MTPLKVLRAAVLEFERRGLKYCLIGGHAASLYRRSERLTKDVDFALLGDPPESSKKLAQAVISAIGLKPALGFIPETQQPKGTSSLKMVTSTPQSGAITGIIDILLPELPWIEDAVHRAQLNKMDLLFANVPIITPEDLIVAKAYALKNAPDRFQDLDDLKEIFTADLTLDVEYILLKLNKHRLNFPEVVLPFVPKRLK